MSEPITLTIAAKDLQSRGIAYNTTDLVNLVTAKAITLDNNGEPVYSPAAAARIPGVNALPPAPTADSSGFEKQRYARALAKQLAADDLAVADVTELRKAALSDTRAKIAALGDVSGEGVSHKDREAYARELAKILDGAL